MATVSNDLKSLECAICLETAKDSVVTSCGHSFCNICIQKWLNQNKSCPSCRATAPTIATASKTSSAAQELLSSQLPAQANALAPVTIRFQQPLVIRDFLNSFATVGGAFPKKTIQTIRSISFHNGVALIVTEKNPLAYRVPQAVIQAYARAKSGNNPEEEQIALNTILLEILAQPSSLQIQAMIPKGEATEQLVSDLKQALRLKLCQVLNNPEARLIDFLEFDSFDDPTKRLLVAVTDSRPREPLVLTMALPADQYFEMIK